MRDIDREKLLRSFSIWVSWISDCTAYTLDTLWCRSITYRLKNSGWKTQVISRSALTQRMLLTRTNEGWRTDRARVSTRVRDTSRTRRPILDDKVHTDHGSEKREGRSANTAVERYAHGVYTACNGVKRHHRAVRDRKWSDTKLGWTPDFLAPWRARARARDVVGNKTHRVHARFWCIARQSGRHV